MNVTLKSQFLMSKHVGATRWWRKGAGRRHCECRLDLGLARPPPVPIAYSAAKGAIAKLHPERWQCNWRPTRSA